MGTHKSMIALTMIGGAHAAKAAVAALATIAAVNAGTGTPASAVALNTAMDGAVDPATLRGAQPQELTAQEKCACIHDNESGLFPGVFDCHRFAEDTCEKFKGVCKLPCKPKKDPRSHNSRYGVYVPH